MWSEHSGVIGAILRRCGSVAEADLDAAWEIHQATGRPLAAVLLERSLMTRQALLERVGEALGMAVMPTPPEVIEAPLRALLPAALALRHEAVPLGERDGVLGVLVGDPFNHDLADDLSFTLGRPLECRLTDPELLRGLLERTYGGPESESREEALAAAGEGPAREEKPGRDPVSLGEPAGEAPVIRLVDLILRQAIRDGASDIHFEPFEEVFQVRYRIAGALHAMESPPRPLALPVISRLKVLADLDIAEQRHPQDGRLKLTVEGRAIDLRISTLPTESGESVVLRVLDKAVVNLDLAALGMPREVLEGVRAVARRPNGIFIVTGPTGSGKTTTLYSALREVNEVGTKILTAEDPVEYEIEGLIQTAINPAVGLDFAAALRAFLRQDPDKILVGEIRDPETARMAVQASLTGHLVLTTLHTNDAPGAVTRLLDMGIEPFLIAASLEAVLAQRLVRALCLSCRRPYVPDEAELGLLDLTGADLGQRAFFGGEGCEHCFLSGYQGRLGLFEWMPLDDGLRQLITDRQPTPRLREAARGRGMRTLRADGVRALLEGRTSAQEVLNHT
jgi:type IV pilus assembly protein PilB